MLQRVALLLLLLASSRAFAVGTVRIAMGDPGEQGRLHGGFGEGREAHERGSSRSSDPVDSASVAHFGMGSNGASPSPAWRYAESGLPKEVPA